ncbi:hypothetical protein HYDPIDRAFT_107116 [Hydnomerulius pinastri MD-312]|nr:hypothetical protein HYDPIDRAFT_107116 [Hydnomerulius pinastri MD-312]
MWRTIPGSKQHEPAFIRPMGLTELGFYWTAGSRGTGDLYQLLAVSATGSSLPSDSRFIETWASVKRRFPLLAAQVRLVEGIESFVVQQNYVSDVRIGELTFTMINSSEVQDFIHNLLDGPRPLSNELLARGYIIRHSDCSNKLHVLLVTTHFIADLKSGATIARTFFDTLSSEREPPYEPLSRRLGMVPASEALWPYDNVATVKRRWRKAIGFALFSIRMAKFRGGNSFPRKALNGSVRSRMLTANVPLHISKAILTNCREQGITFGNAFAILTHIAMSRVLQRLYLQGHMSEEAWQYRRRQPTYTHGPLDLRGYLNPAWYRKGGGGELFLSVSFFYFSLPLMPTSSQAAHCDKREPPPFSDMLSHERFRLRCNKMQTQAQQFLRHPLFLEITTGSHLAHLVSAKSAAERMAQSRTSSDSDEELGSYDCGFSETVFAFGITNVGVVDDLLPMKYPMDPDHPLSPWSTTPHPAKAGFPTPPTPTRGVDRPSSACSLCIDDWQIYLQCQPGELYIGSGVVQEQLTMKVFFDANAYDDIMVREWLEEVKAACIWYLGPSLSEEMSTLQSKL